MKSLLLLALLPLAASAQNTYTTIPWEGHTLYCATDAKGAQSCIMDVPNYWGQQNTPAAADPPPATFAFNTTENHTGGGGALESTAALALMLGMMWRRRALRWERRRS